MSDADALLYSLGIPMREQVRTCAVAAHEVNRAYCISLGDLSQAHWEAAPDWQKASAIEGVLAVMVGRTSEQLHEDWMAAKIRDGWTYGLTKDAEKKTHPCIVPYAQLPPAQQAKDCLFRTVVLATGKAIGLIP